MEKINFQNNITKANADTFNTMQDNIEDAINASSEYLTDYVKFSYASYPNSFTLNANTSTALSITIPTIPGYKAIACVGGKGNGNTGLLISQSIYSNGSINTWVMNTSDVSRTYNSVDFLILYIRDL